MFSVQRCSCNQAQWHIPCAEASASDLAAYEFHLNTVEDEMAKNLNSNDLLVFI